jgi:hypothetical protein
VITYSNICSQGKRKAIKTTPPPESEVQAAYMDMVREQKRYKRLQAEAKIAEAWEAGMYWRLLREAKRAGKGVACTRHECHQCLRQPL